MYSRTSTISGAARIVRRLSISAAWPTGLVMRGRAIGRRERFLPQWQRALLAACAAGGLVLAVSLHFSSASTGGGGGAIAGSGEEQFGGVGGFGGIESLQGGIGSMDEAAAVKLRQAGEYTRGFLLANKPVGTAAEAAAVWGKHDVDARLHLARRDTTAQRSRNFPVTIKDAPHQHLSIEAVPHAAASVLQGLAGKLTADASDNGNPVAASGITPVEYIKEKEQHFFTRDKDEGEKEEVADKESKSMLRCKNMAHVHNLRLLSNKDVSIGLYLLNMELQADEPGVFYADFLMFLRQHDHPMQLMDGRLCACVRVRVCVGIDVCTYRIHVDM